VKYDVLTLTEEYKLLVFENKMLRKISGPKGKEISGSWRKYHPEALHNLNFLSYVIRGIK